MMAFLVLIIIGRLQGSEEVARVQHKGSSTDLAKAKR